MPAGETHRPISAVWPGRAERRPSSKVQLAASAPPSPGSLLKLKRLWARAASPRGTCPVPAAGRAMLSQVTSVHSLLLRARGPGRLRQESCLATTFPSLSDRSTFSGNLSDIPRTPQALPGGQSC